jgi:hypothetical protein
MLFQLLFGCYDHRGGGLVGGRSWGYTWPTHLGIRKRPHAERPRQLRARRGGCQPPPALAQQCDVGLCARLTTDLMIVHVLFIDRRVWQT